ncbi:glycosyltransferase [Porphyrobacter sp. LM 6]|uniref:glycosyltransferase n=1 Tax=Porphyrobacter sp. LM 6 TaxID=1896196 RepID=UPI0008474CC6|nr:glycosyltransferase [Porphyrobacter sp. LM 6]AOL94416.1 Glycosyltransferase involved in cell wall biosynthesis [Porphyrobacter sp. LM 6]
MSGTPAAPLRVLHCHSTFDAGGKEVRAVRLMNAWGGRAQHTIVSAMPQALGARALIDPNVGAHFPADFPSLTGWPTPRRLAGIARAMRGFDLVCTYNWGAMDAVMAHRLFAASFALPPLVHHEDGFNADEADRLKPTRNLYRRAALAGAARVMVPSTGLERTAREVWHVPPSKLERIANGIDTAAFARKPDPSALPIRKGEGEFWVGTLAGLRAVKNLCDLVAAFESLPPEWHLVICGEGPEREAILTEAEALGIAARVHLPGNVDPAGVVGLFDMFALSSQSEQFPLSVVEAMAAGLPVAAPDVGDIRAMLAEPNRALITPRGDVAALGEILARLAADPALRASLGTANRERARAEYDFAAMQARYHAVYAAAAGRDF